MSSGYGRRGRLQTPEQAFGKALKEFREGLGLSQERLGFESGCHRTYISLLERGKKSPSLGTIVRLASALGVLPSEILRRIESNVTQAQGEGPSARSERP
jgi:transcriptional regulator with XRE-family HTH domain